MEIIDKRLCEACGEFTLSMVKNRPTCIVCRELLKKIENNDTNYTKEEKAKLKSFMVDYNRKKDEEKRNEESKEKDNSERNGTTTIELER
jgi:hypothetical protein